MKNKSKNVWLEDHTPNSLIFYICEFPELKGMGKNFIIYWFQTV